MNRKQLIGKKYARLTVIGYSHTDFSSHIAYWECLCDCGNKKIVPTNLLTRGTVKSCGCLRDEKRHFNTLKHGECKNGEETRLYRIWTNMRYRCRKNNSNISKHYYKKGIRVCEEWQDFNNFKSWAYANGYSNDLSIDRIDGNGNYEPTNCRWATAKEQVQNRSINHFITYRGKTLTLSEWSKELGVSRKSILTRLKKGKTMEEISGDAK